MSEAVLQALIRLFAILCRQGGQITTKQIQTVREFIDQIIPGKASEVYFQQFHQLLQYRDRKIPTSQQRISPLDAVEVIGQCFQINETLKLDQKVIVLMKCLELVHSGTPFPESDEVLQTCSDIFKLSRQEFDDMLHFTACQDANELTSHSFLFIGDQPSGHQRSLRAHLHHGVVIVYFNSGSGLLFSRLFGHDRILLNGLVLAEKKVFAIPTGSIMRIGGNAPIYYTALFNAFQDTDQNQKIQFKAEKITYSFSDGKPGLHEFNFRGEDREMIAIMGGSGSGKTTLLGLLSGLLNPTTGSITINGLPLHHRELSGTVGYVSQDDILIDELTVFENLFYNSKLVFGELDDTELTSRIDRILEQLHMQETRNLKVGNIHAKILSGGQRKRLNIGLELMRNPAVIFLDEPISGLSSKDSENVMSLLAEMRQQGRLIFVVIHQPSSDIYKLFDRILLIDKGGYCVYDGHPVEALSYFREAGGKVGKEITHCLACGNIKVQEIFDIIEEKVLDEYGAETSRRKRSPKHWYERFHATRAEATTKLPKQVPVLQQHYQKPSVFQQFKAYLTREFHSKRKNKTYVLLLFFEPFILACILATLIRNSKKQPYSFSENENIPAFVFMSIIVVIFIAMSMSAEEIFRDRKILFREKFLELSRFSYIASKFFFLAMVSAIQVALFILPSKYILAIPGNFGVYWWMLFTVACNASLIGLNISAAFKSAVTIYILIPLLIIPQLILGGALFDYEDLHPSIHEKGFAPLVASIIPARWAYEGLLLEQFLHNPYQNLVYQLDDEMSEYRYRNGAYLSFLYDLIDDQLAHTNKKPGDEANARNYRLVYDELERAMKESGVTAELLPTGPPMTFDEGRKLKSILENLSEKYQQRYRNVVQKRNQFLNDFNESQHDPEAIEKMKSKYHNYQSEMILRRAISEDKCAIRNGELIRLSEPIYLKEPDQMTWRNVYFSGRRNLFKMNTSTFAYNSIVIWNYSLVLFLLVYGNIPKMLFSSMSRFAIFINQSRSNE